MTKKVINGKYKREPIGNITLQPNGKDWVVYAGKHSYWTVRDQIQAEMLSKLFIIESILKRRDSNGRKSK